MLQRWVVACLLALNSFGAWAIAPYIAADRVAAGALPVVAAEVEQKLTAAGFQVVGRYVPKFLPAHGVVVAIDPGMLAKIREFGGTAIVAAPIRVGIATDGSVSYANPDYWYRAYFRKAFDKKESAVKALQGRLESALGAGKGQGGEEPPGNLVNYRYMIGMERLDSPKNKLAEYGSFAEALKTVRDNLAKGAGKTSKVYEVVLPGQKLAVFGVAMNDADNGDGEWIKKIDMQNNIAGLPYEIYIVNNEVGAPHGRFRIALAFPDVGMGQFMRISSLPNAILDTMGAVAGVEKKSSGEAWQ